MKLFPLTEFADEDVCTPHEMNLELGAITQELNGNLDVENVATGAVTKAELQRDWLQYDYLAADPGVTITRSSLSKGQIVRLPTSASVVSHMEISFPAVEGAILIRGGAFLRHTSDESQCWSLAFLVDGRLVWESGTLAAYPRSARDGETAVWVGPGTRKIEMVIRSFDPTLDLLFVSGNLYVKQYGV